MPDLTKNMALAFSLTLFMQRLSVFARSYPNFKQNVTFSVQFMSDVGSFSIKKEEEELFLCPINHDGFIYQGEIHTLLRYSMLCVTRVCFYGK